MNGLHIHAQLVGHSMCAGTSQNVCLPTQKRLQQTKGAKERAPKSCHCPSSATASLVLSRVGRPTSYTHAAMHAPIPVLTLHGQESPSLHHLGGREATGTQGGNA